MFDKIIQAWRVKSVRNKLLYVLSMMIIFRLVAHIPIPEVNLENLRNFLSGNQILGLLNVFSGGTMKNFSIVMLGVAPYITSSIIFQLLTMIVPKLEEMSKEGEAGQAKINSYTRLLSVPLAFLQSYGMIRLLNSNSAAPILSDLNSWKLIIIMTTITAGTVFLMWIGELISEKKVGNGISLLIFAGIVAGLPGLLRNAIINYTSADFYTFVLFALIAVATVVGVVFITEGQRNIPVNYAKQVRGGRTYGGNSSHLPLRVNMAGVIPIIFAISLVLFPPMVAQFFVGAKSAWIAGLASKIIVIFQNQIFYGVVYFLLVFGFTYFYTAVIFHPQKIAENLQKQGGFIPGIRPGKETETYLQKTMSRINLTGASFLGLIAVMPLLLQAFMGTQNLAIGGTSLLIVVAVAIDIAKQIDAQLTMHAYDRI
ncbi:MAG: preprotein translocase subunit SecY [Candidatus Magasanikbacteria bacterium CG10_big_fil_rev_8_21_14_0_10_40_10]|uniref:Protein translocase subunit SecY n=1 Tax=Candidatus Magasanikbacteria bacterium CG10_big_fil_rev_8_21_14_0_10_40_10 TaxID=1974648 RepID=A0A2M6W591_9BACT|nr:MAG: preprotein translocase subunit SecY [Candidatus Magasanikbacteria bacterium CG10_big_fil_rev_8_21_14_0_10_40_10]